MSVPSWRPSAWEASLVVLIIIAVLWSSFLSPFYLSADQILYSSRHFIIPGLLALGLNEHSRSRRATARARPLEAE